MKILREERDGRGAEAKAENEKTRRALVVHGVPFGMAQKACESAPNAFLL